MKRTPAPFAIGLLVALVLSSCVSSPDAPSGGTAQAETTADSSAGAVTTAEAADSPGRTEPVLRERVEEYQVPVLVRETQYFADGVVNQTTEYTWSTDLLQLKASLTRKPSLAEPAARTVYEYAGALLVSRTNYGPDGAVVNRSAYKHDEAGQLVSETLTDGKNVIQSVSEWTWANGNKQVWRVLDAKGLVLSQTAYSYQDGRLAELLMSDSAGNSTGRGEYRYDESGTLVGIRYFSAAGTPQDRIEFVVDGGLAIQENSYRTGDRLERSKLYEYGPEGQVLKMTLADASGRPRESTAYEYAFRTATRTVSYYE